MKEYNKHIQFYRNNYNYQYYSKLIQKSDWGNVKDAELYLDKYWLTEIEYLNIWKPIQDKIYIRDTNLPELIYYPEFEIIAMNGGCLFIEEDFMQLQEILQEIGEEYFVVIQHSQEFTNGEPMFRMKFPVDITWNEVISGNYISSILIEMPFNEYYVFGRSGKWGKYAANDYKYPIDIFGFKPEIRSIFKEKFKQTKQEELDIQKALPRKYFL